MRFKKLLAVAAIGVFVVALGACDLEGSGPNDTYAQALQNNYHAFDSGTFQGAGGFTYGDSRDEWAIGTGSQLPAGTYHFVLGVPTSEGTILGDILDKNNGSSAATSSSLTPDYCNKGTCYYHSDVTLTAASALDVYFVNFRLPNDRGTDGYVFEIAKA
jgi:hypothetical protein